MNEACNNFIAINKNSWNQKTGEHYNSNFYDVIRIPGREIFTYAYRTGMSWKHRGEESLALAMSFRTGYNLLVPYGG